MSCPRRCIGGLTVLFICGCGVTVPQDHTTNPQLDPHPPIVAAFDACACADAIAHQAELANDSPAFKASEVLDGILTFGADAGIPKEFAAKVRQVCPAIGAHPAGDLSADQMQAIRNVR